MNNYYLGIMSGTSLDGVDLALLDFNYSPPQMVAAAVMPMPQNLREKLTALLHTGQTHLSQLGEIDHQLGLLYANSVQEFLSTHKFNPMQIKAIGCHGQTLWHSPNSESPFTMQIGDMNIVAARTGITTVGDFRRKDMAYGGQGAPLVPAFHQALFADPKRLTVVLNIGGISNISILAPNHLVTGYDVGAGNTLMDLWIARYQDKTYDRCGEWARSGSINQGLLAELLNEPFLQKSPPKSTGRELFNLSWLEQKLAHYRTISTALISAEDIQRTLLEFTALCIVNELHQLSDQDLPYLLLVCGGGARNSFLMERLRVLLPCWQVSTTSEFGFDEDYVEAAAFAWLAYQRMNNLPSNLPSVTGAKRAVSLGVIYPKDEELL